MNSLFFNLNISSWLSITTWKLRFALEIDRFVPELLRVGVIVLVVLFGINQSVRLVPEKIDLLNLS